MVRRLWPLRPQVHMEPRDSPILQRSEPGLHGLTRSSGVLREFGGKKGSCPLHRRICLLHRPDLSVAYIFRSMQQTDTSMQWTAAFFFFFFAAVHPLLARFPVFADSSARESLCSNLVRSIRVNPVLRKGFGSFAVVSASW